MSQIPLIMIGGGLKGFFLFNLFLHFFFIFFSGTFLGNALFWFGMVFGPPLISILYTREYYLIRMGLGTEREREARYLDL